MDALRAVVGLNRHATADAVMGEVRQLVDSERAGESKQEPASTDPALVLERRAPGGTAFNVTRRAIPGWSAF